MMNCWSSLVTSYMSIWESKESRRTFTQLMRESVELDDGLYRPRINFPA